MGRLSVVLGAAVAIAAAAPAGAAEIFEDVGTFDAIVLRLDPSARSLAMGGASGAVFWGELNGWSNPAVLGLARGLRYELETTGMAFGFEYEARRAVLGWGGLGVTLAGRPVAGVGGLRLGGDFTIGIPEEPPYVFRFEEEVESWSVGASISELATSIARKRGGRAPRFARFADLALGFSQKSFRGSLGSFVASASAMDWGLLIRTGASFTAIASDCRIDLAYGYSVQNANEGVMRPHRHGTAVRLSLDAPALSSRRAALGLQPLISLGGAWDRVFVTSGRRRVGDETRLGAEIGVANVAFLRLGEGPSGSVSASGYGFALPIGRLARVRYDRARVSTEDFFETTTDGWSVWLDPLAILGAWRGE